MEPTEGLEFGDSDAPFVVYDDRVEARAKKRSQSIAFAEIAEVQVTKRPRRLVIVTHEGKHLQFNIGRDSEAARSTIVRRMSSGI
ncbi:MAG: hypothetical protein KC482_02295 [Dehalococcoidia bacterium]|nr:hypothetical protein [Dehalococcoidia bacterium]MCA9824111.1 hypothetical protein [Dehalococcoidia bacterium]MCA9845569.1 hypothetical protein [Dehalococcoidia bacterium]MCA9852422.1 hypothetical protein [Dehalococcoidia bacterium]